MEIVEDRDDYCEEEEDEEKQMLMGGGEMGKHQTFPFYPSSSSPSPSPSSSSSQYKGGAAPQQQQQSNGRWGAGQIHDYKQQRMWNNMGGSGLEHYSASRDHHEGTARSTTSATTNNMGFSSNIYGQLDAMDMSPLSHHHRPGRVLDDGDGNSIEEGLATTGGGGGGGGGGGFVVEREHMFDKVVTPSDVGKLNRLVIPKQHAEKYFPLDSSANEKGLLLSFEDRSGKPWRFRYSYWNSSQSYVMTKGWSRFVKEKKLDAGDIVSFERGVGEVGKDRLYIDWKRRPDTAPPDLYSSSASASASSFRGVLHYPLSSSSSALHRSLPWGRVFFPPTVSLPMPPPQTGLMQQQQHHLSYGYNHHMVNPAAGSVFYLRSAAPPHGVASLQHHAGPAGGGGHLGVVGGGGDHAADSGGVVFDSVPVVHGNKAAAKRLRLFGVNLDCPTTGDETGDNDVLSSAAHTTMDFLLPPHHPHQPQPQPSPPLQLRLCAAGPLPISSQDHLPRKTRQSLSFDLDI